MSPKKAASPEVAEAGADDNAEEEDLGEQDEGFFVFPDGSEYNGQYIKYKKNDSVVCHGTGSLKTGPEYFNGVFENGEYKTGQFTSCSGAVYSGSFRRSMFHGPGEYSWPDGRKYRGMWKDGYMHGRGEYQNFSFGVDRMFKGISVRGRFVSGQEEQKQAKASFLKDYGLEYKASARAFLAKLSALLGPVEVEDPKAKAKKGGEVTAELPPGVLQELLVPGESDESPEAVSLLKQVAEVCDGPYPDAATLNAATLGAFAAHFVESEEDSTTAAEPRDSAIYDKNMNMITDRTAPAGSDSLGFDARRLRKEQLEHQGQAIEILGPSAEPGALQRMVLVNVSAGGADAKWCLIHCDDVPQPS